MLSVPVLDLNKKEVGDLEVPEEIFKAELRPDILQIRCSMATGLSSRRNCGHQNKRFG